MELTPPDYGKTAWGPGPWLDEPDRVEWTHAGLPCLMVRHPRHGSWCGYAAVPPGHPLHGTSAFDVDSPEALNYSGRCSGFICHVPQPGEPDDVWWFGFDCAHMFDVTPAMDATLRTLGFADLLAFDDLLPLRVYRTVDEVRGRVTALAEQLAAAL